MRKNFINISMEEGNNKFRVERVREKLTDNQIYHKFVNLSW